jgi:N-acetylneuraminic acid mutarotase
MRYLKGFSLLLLMASLAACSKSSDTTTTVGNWLKNRAQFGGVGRNSAASFTIDDKVYITTGYDGFDRLQDLWMYDVDKNLWTQKKAFTGAPRSNAVGMAMGGFGYVGTGYNGTSSLNDFYKYDPVNDSWETMPAFPGAARYGAIAFAVKDKNSKDKGYITTGYDKNWFNDNWQFNPETKTWVQAQSLTVGKRQDASVFVINNKAYVCMGTANSTAVTDFYAFDGGTEAWSPLNPIANVSDDSFDDNYNFAGYGAASFVMNGKGYIVSGLKGSGSYSAATWEYTPGTDRWIQKTDFEGAARYGATGFSVKNRGFVVLGQSSSLQFDNMFEFDPNAEYNKND